VTETNQMKCSLMNTKKHALSRIFLNRAKKVLARVHWGRPPYDRTSHKWNQFMAFYLTLISVSHGDSPWERRKILRQIHE